MEWHDAVLLGLHVDRTAPGKRDEILLLVEWPGGRKQKLRFMDCYALDVEMNFGVIAPESILDARCIADMPKLAAVKQRWLAVGVELEGLLCFEISTNSTSSELRIYAKRFEVSDA